MELMKKITNAVFKSSDDDNKDGNKENKNGVNDNVEETEDVCRDVDRLSLRPEIIREDVKLADCCKAKLAFVLYNVFTEKECKDFIAKTEKMGYDMALVNVGAGRQMKMQDVRNNSRCIWDSVEEADRIYQRIKSHIPQQWNGRACMGLNERLRFLRYYPGEYFKPHMDGQYRRSNGERSFITIQLYLNEGFKGGSTTFFGMKDDSTQEVVPKTGMVLVFQHDILHEGSQLLKGVKYTIRTDVMYSNQVTALPDQNKAPQPVDSDAQ